MNRKLFIIFMLTVGIYGCSSKDVSNEYSEHYIDFNKHIPFKGQYPNYDNINNNEHERNPLTIVQKKDLFYCPEDHFCLSNNDKLFYCSAILENTGSYPIYLSDLEIKFKTNDEQVFNHNSSFQDLRSEFYLYPGEQFFVAASGDWTNSIDLTQIGIDENATYSWREAIRELDLEHAIYNYKYYVKTDDLQNEEDDTAEERTREKIITIDHIKLVPIDKDKNQYVVEGTLTNETKQELVLDRLLLTAALFDKNDDLLLVTTEEENYRRLKPKEKYTFNISEHLDTLKNKNEVEKVEKVDVQAFYYKK